MPRTSHGLVNSDIFLTQQVQKDVGGASVHVQECSWTDDHWDVHIELENRPGHRINLPQLTWKEADFDTATFGDHRVTVESIIFDTGYLRRRFKLKISGLEEIPNVRVPRFDRLYAEMYGEHGFYPRDHPALLEFKRRWKIETAHNQAKQARERLKRLRAEGSYLQD